MACHSDQALALIDTPSRAQNDILGGIRFTVNHAVVHSDQRFMPKRRSAWSSWVYLKQTQLDQSASLPPGISLSYWMNNLQPLSCSKPVFVTLNPHQAPDPELTYDNYTFTHPKFDQSAITAQSRMHEIQGQNQLWYCGAWQRYGFHEDGLQSAINLAAEFGITPPWQQSHG